MTQPAIRNFLVDRLGAALGPHLTPTTLASWWSSRGERNEQVMFPDEGVVAISQSSVSHGAMAVALIGSEGVIGLSAILGSDMERASHTVVISGRGHKIEAGRFRALLATNPDMLSLMLSYAHVFMSGLTYSALSAGRGTIDHRLSRCLLMLQDRIGGVQIPVTHDDLAALLGKRRPGITDALHRLEGDHLIRSSRGLVVIRDRDGLQALAADSYGHTEREYVRLIGDPHPMENDHADRTPTLVYPERRTNGVDRSGMPQRAMSL